MANFGWKYGAATAGNGDDCPTCNPSASCSADVSALWTSSPSVPNTITYDGYFETDTRYVAKIDKTIIHIAKNFKGYRAHIVNR